MIVGLTFAIFQSTRPTCIDRIRGTLCMSPLRWAPLQCAPRWRTSTHTHTHTHKHAHTRTHTWVRGNEPQYKVCHLCQYIRVYYEYQYWYVNINIHVHTNRWTQHRIRQYPSATPCMLTYVCVCVCVCVCWIYVYSYEMKYTCMDKV